MKKSLPLFITLSFLTFGATFAQGIEADVLEKLNDKPELKHYAPLYLDIPAELNVRKGYKEVDVAGGYADFRDFNGVRSLIEYDFAPINNLGFEIEVPFVFVHDKHPFPAGDPEEVVVPEEGGAEASAMALRLGFTYTVLTLPTAKTTFAVGYNNELETSPFKESGGRRFGDPVFSANVYNPFLVAAKVWGERFHSMIYTGPAIKQDFESNKSKTQYRLNTILSYRFGKGDNESFAGVECNQSFGKDLKAQLLLRPQVQLHLSERWKLGLIAGIPVETETHLKGSGFIRVMYSPGSRR